jgi:uncharacterized protein with gpF-like domain
MPFKPSRRIEVQYYRDILGLVRKYFGGAYHAVHASFISVPEWLGLYAHQAAERMVTNTLAENARSWRAAALEAGQGPRIYNALQRELRSNIGARYNELISENAQFIKTLPASVASQFVKETARYQREGIRADDLAFQSKLLQHVTRAQATRLARTESAKASAALTQARAEDLGLQWYVWQTSQDQRVRQSPPPNARRVGEL